jgi:hypothetical protein
MILSAHLLLLFIITYSASSISHCNKVLFRDLYSFGVKNKLQIHSKLMVSNYWEKFLKKIVSTFYFTAYELYRENG